MRFLVVSLHKDDAVESISKFFKNSTQLYTSSVLKSASKCLRVKCRRTKARAEKANKLKTEMNKSKHKLRQVNMENSPFS